MASLVKALLAIGVATVLFDAVIGADIVVGAPNGGWDLSTDYKTWAASQKFTVGDSLIFQYASTHSVLEVSKSDYDACITSNPTFSDGSGSTSIPLSSQGQRYFICGTPNHCPGGMKLEINIVAADSSTPPASPPTPLSPPAVPSTPPTTAPPPVPRSPLAMTPRLTPTSAPPTVSSPASPPTPQPEATSPSAPPSGSSMPPSTSDAGQPSAPPSGSSMPPSTSDAGQPSSTASPAQLPPSGAVGKKVATGFALGMLFVFG